MAFPPDSPRGDELIVTIDSVEVPDVVEVSGLSLDPDVIESKQQTTDGKYVTRQLSGRAKTGEFTVTRGITRSVTIGDWFRDEFGRDVGFHPFDVAVVTRDQSGNPRETFTFGTCHVRSIETDVITSTEAVVIAYEEADSS